LLVLGSQVDTTITFGVDARTGQPLAARLGSALVAADQALREGTKWKSYDPSQSEDIAWKLSLLSQLDQAIDDGNIWIAFQPKMDVSTRSIIGAEALARWNHPEKGAINPIDFIPAAEQSGRIGKLTDYVLARSIEAAASLNRPGTYFTVAVNLSARLIDGTALAETVSRLLTQHNLPPTCLTLEITETAALAGYGKDLGILKELRNIGVQLSIDDYGTGLSTLDYMKRIPATEIKIDKSFIEAIEKSRSDRLMVHSTIQLAHSLGQKVVAEGVERPETLEMLALMGCDIAQGYLIGHPLPLEEFHKLLTKRQRAA
jgi:EAL domain-containing protein (putative c-di-GMP-specific phosphodiesterase class I)